MRVLTVLDSMRPGGVRERSYQLTRALRAAGHDAVMLAPAPVGDLGWMPEEVARSVIAVAAIGTRFPLPVGLPRIWREVKAADAIQLMSHWAALHVLVFIIARLLRKQYVMCPAGALRVYGRSRVLKRVYNAIVGTRIVRGAARLLAITADERQSFFEYGVDAARGVVMPNAVDPRQFVPVPGADFRAAAGVGDAPFVLFLGRLNPIKGPDLLLEAFLRVQDGLDGLHLVFVGPDEGMEAGLRKAAAGNPRIHFAGAIGGAAKVDAFRQASFVAIPSRHEAMSIVVLEAGACGTAVLATDACGFPRVEEVSGGCVVPATVEGLAAGLVRMPSLVAGGAGERLRQMVERDYSWTASVDAHLALFRAVMKESASRAGATGR